MSDPKLPTEVASYYDHFPEETRLSTGPSRLEFERTKEILSRMLPRAPARVVDVGGAAVECDPSIVGASAHLLATGTK